MPNNFSTPDRLFMGSSDIVASNLSSLAFERLREKQSLNSEQTHALE
jgi:hypothetical protein